MVMKEEVKKIIVSTSPCAQLVWYSEKFLKGEWDKEECVTEWEKYRACLSSIKLSKNKTELLGQLKDLKDDLALLRVAKVTGGTPNKLSKM
ncbi:hypothetical protein MKW94_004406 [Papaver nudicaule]|uniref:Uncharacterized protein n=1 Tax=Papaver nudicaule TaxID=74823 RepID=A0AA41V9Z1_PAPNU|nr:hypothetical protein [Papaver nudicaule]